MNAFEPGQAAVFTFEPSWSQKLSAATRGLAHARERDWVLAWDANHWMYLFDHGGHRQGQARFAGALVSAAFADDGSAVVAVGTLGEVVWLAPDLMPRWRQTLPHPCLAVAVDPFGQYAAISDRSGNLTLCNRLGQSIFRLKTPRPLHHLAFVPGEPVLLGCADLGLVLCLDMAGTIRWRDGLFANAGALATSGDGSRILVACFSEGLQVYDLQGDKKARIAVPEPCRLAALSFTGQFIAISGMTSQRLFLLDPGGQVLGSHRLDQDIVTLALSPLCDRTVLGLADGSIVALRVLSGGAGL